VLRPPLRTRDPHAHAVERPGARLLRRLPLRFLGVGGRGANGRAAAPTVQLVPLVDCLVVVVLFLLHSFHASGE
jgi:hypothetical protein